MDFEIKEKVRQHNFYDEVKKIFLGILRVILLILLMPFFFILWVWGKFRKEEESNLIVESEIIFENESIKLARLFIDENDYPEDLDYPEICNDIYLNKYESEPYLKELEGKFFDAQFIESQNGIYLISFNHEGQGMTLWFINKVTPEIKPVKELSSNWWIMSIRENKVILNAKGKDKVYHIEINEEQV
jgi:hypothetical protein